VLLYKKGIGIVALNSYRHIFMIERNYSSSFYRSLYAPKRTIRCSADSRTRAKSKSHSTVTVSLPGTLTARGEDVRRYRKSSEINMTPTSVKQEPNIDQAL